jgi:hypothetical protein
MGLHESTRVESSPNNCHRVSGGSIVTIIQGVTNRFSHTCTYVP